MTDPWHAAFNRSHPHPKPEAQPMKTRTEILTQLTQDYTTELATLTKGSPTLAVNPKVAFTKRQAADMTTAFKWGASMALEAVKEELGKVQLPQDKQTGQILGEIMTAFEL